MNLALGLSVMLLGGWVLPSGEGPSDDIQAPQIKLAPGTPQLPREGSSRRTMGGPLDSGSPSGNRYGGSRAPLDPNTTAPMRTQEMPFAPTDPDLRSPDSPLALPTENSSGGTLGYGTRTREGSSGYAPTSPRQYRPPTSPLMRPKSSGQTAQQNRMRSELLANEQQASRMQPSAGIGGAASRLKPFAGYTPAPAVSPYQNLYRPSSGGTLDNYTQLVRPQLDQGRANSAFGGEIRGLQSSQRLQSSALQRLGKQNPKANQNVIAPEYFQNYGSFYPSFSR